MLKDYLKPIVTVIVELLEDFTAAIYKFPGVPGEKEN
jgi:hypothetical protein